MAEIPGFYNRLIFQCESLYCQVGQGQHHATVVERATAGVDHKGIAKPFGKYLMGMTDDEQVIVKIFKFFRPVLFLFFD